MTLNVSHIGSFFEPVHLPESSHVSHNVRVFGNFALVALEVHNVHLVEADQSLPKSDI